MNKLVAIVLPFSLLALFGVLLAWAGLGFDHQVLTHWAVVIDSTKVYVEKAKGTYHHGWESITALATFLGVVWVLLALWAAAIARAIWKKNYRNW